MLQHVGAGQAMHMLSVWQHSQSVCVLLHGNAFLGVCMQKRLLKICNMEEECEGYPEEMHPDVIQCVEHHVALRISTPARHTRTDYLEFRVNPGKWCGNSQA